MAEASSSRRQSDANSGKEPIFAAASVFAAAGAFPQLADHLLLHRTANARCRAGADALPLLLLQCLPSDNQ